MNINNSYFSIINPLLTLERWLHPYRNDSHIDYKGKQLHIAWTARAEQAFQTRDAPLTVEMQIYFSCVIQKRILFHNHCEYPTKTVNDTLNITLRPVQAESCDPVEFAKNHPVDHEYTSAAAKKLHPSQLLLDFKKGMWSGEFTI